MKAFKILLGIIILAGGAYFGMSLVNKNKTVNNADLSTQFEVESNRFSQFTEMTNVDKETEELIGEGGNLVRNFSAISKEKVDRLKDINDILEKKYAALENNATANFAELTTKFEKLAESDLSKLTDENKTKAEDLISQGKSIIMNRMAISELKVSQLREVVEELETLLP